MTRRPVRHPRTTWKILALTAGVFASGCTAAAGGAVLLVGAGAAALVRGCYDHISISVYDGGAGHVTCDATVTATRDGDTVELRPCYHASLTEGTWQLRASRPGYVDATSTVVVLPSDECSRYVQSVELWLAPVGSQGGAAQVVTPPAVSPPTAVPSPPSAPAPEPAAPQPSLEPGVPSNDGGTTGPGSGAAIPGAAEPSAPSPSAPSPSAATPTSPAPTPPAPTQPSPADRPDAGSSPTQRFPDAP